MDDTFSASIRLPPRLADQYELGQQFAEGGMGLLYLGRHLELNCQVVFKFINPEFMEDVESRTRFEREGQITRKLQHPNIVKVFDVGEDEGLLYIIYELVEGENLKDRIERLGFYPLDQGIEIMRQMCDGISFAHARGIMHRDIKPENIIITDRDSKVKILDFGIAKPMGSGYTLTQAGYIIGTPEYLSPEQAAGNPATPASDQYALGVLAFEILTGRLPIEEENTLDYFSKKIRGDLTPLSAFLPDFPRNLELAIEKALAVNPKDRYEAVGGFALSLEAFQKGKLDESGRVKNAAPPVRVSTAHEPLTAAEKTFSSARSSLRIVAPPTREIVIPTKPIIGLVLIAVVLGFVMGVKSFFSGISASWSLTRDIQLLVDVDTVTVQWADGREVDRVEWIGTDSTQVLRIETNGIRPTASISSKLAADSVKLAFEFSEQDPYPGDAEIAMPGITRKLTGVDLKLNSSVSSPRIRWRVDGETYQTPKSFDEVSGGFVKSVDLDPDKAYEMEILGRTWTGNGAVMPGIRVMPGLAAIQGPLNHLEGLRLMNFFLERQAEESLRGPIETKNRAVQKVLDELESNREALRQISNSPSISQKLSNQINLQLAQVDLFRAIAAGQGVPGLESSIRERFGVRGFKASYVPLNKEPVVSGGMFGSLLDTDIVVAFESSPDLAGTESVEIVFQLMTDHAYFAIWIAVNGVDQTVFWGPVDWAETMASKGALSQGDIRVNLPASVFQPGVNRIEFKPRALAILNGRDPGIEQGGPLGVLKEKIHISVDGKVRVPVKKI